jgi:hypothetical protein
MSLTRHTITAGIVVLGLALTASPAMAKHGGDGGDPSGTEKAANTIVTFISPAIDLPVNPNNGGSNRPSRPRA